MKLKMSSLIALLFLFTACGQQEEAVPPTMSQLVLDLELPQTFSEEGRETLLNKIEFYCFTFKGSFTPLNPIPVSRRDYAQYVFPSIPFDERLQVIVTAVSKTCEDQPLCTGEVTIPYSPGKKDRVIISLRCS